MGDYCLQTVVLKLSTDRKALAFAKKHGEEARESFAGNIDQYYFAGNVYEFDNKSLPSPAIMDGDCTAFLKDGRILLVFSYYDGGGDLIDAIEDTLERFERKFLLAKAHLADDLQHLAKGFSSEPEAPKAARGQLQSKLSSLLSSINPFKKPKAY